MRLGSGLLEELFEVPRDYPTGLYVGHSFIDGVPKRTKLPGLSQQIAGRRLLHFLREQLKGFYGFLDG
jgi:hypothetical protein